MADEGMHISVEAAPGYEPSDKVREALEQLAEAVAGLAAERDDEVEAFAMPERRGTPGFGSLFDMSPVSRGPISNGPIAKQGLCLGSYTIHDDDHGDLECNWVYWS